LYYRKILLFVLKSTRIWIKIMAAIMSDPILLNNRYQLEERLGSGGMAVVYRARDLMLERNVAVKILRESYSDDPSFQERFRQEAKAAANLSHPNIVTVHDFGLDRGRLFIVMEYVPGTHLKSILQRRGRLSVEEAIGLMIQACAGVGYAHRAGLVHCDIKPHNFLITPDKRLKVTDFGIARALASIHPEETLDVVWGSPQYFSPEQAAGAAPSPASDVYSLGVILYEMLTGRLPFEADSATELANLHRTAVPPPPRQFNPSIPASLEQILLKVLSKEPSARYRSADQLGRVLVTLNTQPTTPGSGVETTAVAAAPALATVTKAPPAQMVPAPAPAPAYGPRPPLSPARQAPRDNPLNIDWITIGLGLLAMIAVLGLIPLILWIYLLYQ
jgi:serine/threonine protein kinase